MIGNNTLISKFAKIGNNVSIMHNCIVEDNVEICDEVFIDSNTIIRNGTKIGKNTTIGSNCIIGEYLMDYYEDRQQHNYNLVIGDNSIIRSSSIIYTDSIIGNNFQTGHNVVIREKTNIGNHCSIGTASDLQGYCEFGDYVRLHSDVHVGQLTKIDDYVWIFPRVTFTNDPMPPSDIRIGIHVHSFAIIATNVVILPGKDIAQDSLVGAGSVVTKDVPKYKVVCGNPARVVKDVRDIKEVETGDNHYPWREHFERNMPWRNVGFDKWATMNNYKVEE